MGEYGGLELGGGQNSSLQLDYDDASVGFNAANGSVVNNDSTIWSPDGTTVAPDEEKVYWALLLLILPGLGDCAASCRVLAGQEFLLGIDNYTV
ncbi:hypothetical protein BIW11_07466 [Tropilaelaps mercedesae]|uniref:Uncharacterized protein n=1 Tax=Tropilaelaps mercedesae TaxID=418985 RepID=A0A1V9XTY4_9ACAR|nr:hypothetical protein BIW11_07466 [Tropilaelaps mercedesae]